MNEHQPRPIEDIVVPQIGQVVPRHDDPTGVAVLDAAGAEVRPIAHFLRGLIADGGSRISCRSYALDLLRWWRFLNAIGVQWNDASHWDFTDFILWMRTATPQHGGNRRRNTTAPSDRTRPGFAPRTINHTVAVLTGFYDFQLRIGALTRSPVVSRGPSDEPRRDAHHNPMYSFDTRRRTRGRQKIPREAPKSIPDTAVDALLGALRSDRDRAAISFYLSTGARASELLNVCGSDLDWGEQTIRVIRKGAEEPQWLSASPEAFTYLRKYLGDRRLSPTEPIWKTLRKPYRPLNYFAMRAVFVRANESLGTQYTLHQLRHTAAYRMAQDPELSLSDVQRVLNHAFLSSTQIYTQPHDAEVIQRVAEHHRRRQHGAGPVEYLSPDYNADSLNVLFGRGDDDG